MQDGTANSNHLIAACIELENNLVSLDEISVISNPKKTLQFEPGSYHPFQNCHCCSVVAMDVEPVIQVCL